MKVCICGTIKNVAEHISGVIQNMEKIGSLFDDYVIIIYYDHSTDNTLQQVKNYQKQNPKIQLYVNNIPLTKFRTHNIAKGRNFCLNTIRNDYSDYEYFIMMDCDDVCSGNINTNILKNYLLIPETWDALSFNRQEYYDVWGLSIPPYVMSVRHFHNIVNAEKQLRKFIKESLGKLKDHQLLRCFSAFNGLSIYKTQKFINCNYNGTLRLDLIPLKMRKINEQILHDKFKINFKNNGNEDTIYEDCEHRSFHLQAIKKNNAKICISPQILFS